MLTIGLIREEKIPADNRVAFTPSQCDWIQKKNPDVKIIVQTSDRRCFSDKEYSKSGIEVTDDMSHCDILMGIKEVQLDKIIPGKTYVLFSHTKKMQPQNKKLIRELVKHGNTLIDYECLQHEDGTRILGFGFFAGIVGAHNGMMAYGKRSGKYDLQAINSKKTLQHLIHTYFGLKIPRIKIAVTGNGRVAHGILEIMNLMGIYETEPELFLSKEFTYPVFVHLKAGDLYQNKLTGEYSRNEFHHHPEKYKTLFDRYISQTDILMNGVYWEKDIPRLFELSDMKKKDFRIATISDISDDVNGSVPCNIRQSTIEEPAYGVDKNEFTVTAPYIAGSVDMIAIGNLPNELPRDASRYFGEQLIKYFVNDLIHGASVIIDNATILQKGKLTTPFNYLKEYAAAE
ncbi:MAG: alanine dehydrogenase [Chitinophagaceae bacterium]|nr:alanine dehydrogenase [Chitinophagaceae bacterium]